MLIGADDVLPHARIGETQQLGKEFTYAAEVGGLNGTTSSMLANSFFSDAPYADLDPILLAGKPVFVEDLGLGRLVETGSQIEAQIAQFVNTDTNGTLKLDSAFVAGYDFLADQADELAGILDTSNTLIRPDWTAGELASRLATVTGPDIVSVNAHADHSRVVSALGDSGTADVNAALESLDAAAGEVPAPAPGALWFTVGCHAGFSVPNRVGQPGAPTRPGDWPEYTTDAAVYIANTGYGYGDDTEIGYSERLFNDFASILTQGGISAGEAWTQAKREYASRLSNFDAYDYKVLQQGVLYGLPMYDAPAVGEVQGFAVFAQEAAVETPLVVKGEIAPVEGVGGLLERSVDASYLWGDDPAPSSELFRTVAGDVEVKDGYPIVPRSDIDITSDDPLNEVARGAIIESLSSRGPIAAAAEYSRAVVGLAGGEPDIESDSAVFPTAFQAITSVIDGDVATDRLVLFPGQYRSATGEFTLLDQVTTTVYYAQVQGQGDDARIADTVKPEIISSSADSIPGAVLFKVVATDDQDVARVVVQYLDAGTWRKVELAPSVLTDGEYVGQFPNPVPGEGRYFIQVLDTGGNVAISSFKGNYYEVGFGLPDAVVVARTDTDPVRALAEDEWSNVPVDVEVVGEIDDGWTPTVGKLVTPATETAPAVYTQLSPTPVDPTDPSVVRLEDDGVYEVKFTRELDGGQLAKLTRIVRIDQTAPTVAFDPAVEVLFPGDEPVGIDPVV